MKKITGVIPALITPFDENENLDEDRLRKVVRYLADQKVDGLYLTGSTGETFLMDPAERKRVVEVVKDEVGDEVPLIVHVGDIGTKLSIDLAKHAEASGAAAISSVPPFYWKFSEKAIIEYYADIAGSTSLPMIVYNVPLAGEVGFSTLEKLAEIPNVAGVKYTLSSHYDIMRLKKDLGDDFVIYSGSDEMAMSGMAFGADGLIGSFYNVIPDLYLQLFQAFQDKNLPLLQEKQQLANAIIFTALKHDYIPLIKRMMAWMGLDAGYSRRPFHQYTPEEEAVIREEFKPILSMPGASEVAFLRALGASL